MLEIGGGDEDKRMKMGEGLRHRDEVNRGWRE